MPTLKIQGQSESESESEFFLDEDEDDEDEGDDTEGQRPYCQRCALRIVGSSVWENFILLAIAANTFCQGAEAQVPRFMDGSLWLYVDNTFTMLFTFEIAMRLAAYGICGFFCAKDWEDRRWNIFDFVIVVTGLVTFVVRPSRVQQQGDVQVGLSGDDQYPDLLLLLRGLRILRALRMFHHCEQLRMLMNGIAKSFVAVAWIFVLLFLLILIFSISTTSVVGNSSYLWDGDDNEKIIQLFGNLGRSMWTLFQFVTLDDWSSIIELVSKKMWFMRFFFLIYTLLASFALISLLSGVMAEHIISESQDSQRLSKEIKVRAYIGSMEDRFKKLQGEGASPTLGLHFEDLERLVDTEEVKTKLRKSGLDLCSEDILEVYRAMDQNGDGIITWDEFRHGLRHIHGPAGARELAVVHADVQSIRACLLDRTGRPGSPMRNGNDNHGGVSKRLDSMDERLGHIEATMGGRLERIEAALGELLNRLPSSPQRGFSGSGYGRAT